MVMLTEEFKNIKSPVGFIRISGPLPTKQLVYDSRWHTLDNSMIPEERRKVFQVLVSTVNNTLAWINVCPHDLATWDEFVEYEKFLKRHNLFPKVEPYVSSSSN